MFEWNVTELFLTGLVTYGPGVLVVALFLGALGVLPSTLFVLAAGAIVRQGIFSAYTAFPLALAAVVVGDTLSYGIGYFFRDWINEFQKYSSNLRRVRTICHERFGLAIYFTRFAFTPLAIPVNLLSGGTGYPYYRFFLFDLLGEVTWLILYGTIGFVFASQWELLGEIFNNVFGGLLGLLLLVGGIYLILTDKVGSFSFLRIGR